MKLAESRTDPTWEMKRNAQPSRACDDITFIKTKPERKIKSTSHFLVEIFLTQPPVHSRLLAESPHCAPDSAGDSAAAPSPAAG
jgi:hypothetical protein